MHETIPRRKASYLERYCVMSRNAGYPNIMVYLVTFGQADSSTSIDPSLPGPSSPVSTSPPGQLITRSNLAHRIDLLQTHFPMLWAEVVDGRTTKPYFQPREKGHWKADDVITERYTDQFDVQGLARPSDQYKKETQMIKREIERMERDSDPRTRPPWQITLLRRRPDPTNDAPLTPPDSDPLEHLLLAVEHTHFDGQAGLNFLSLLLLPPSHPTLFTLPNENLADIPACEETLDLRPGFRQMTSVMADKVFVPMLPGPLRRRIQGDPAWPGKDVMRSPMGVEWGLTGGWIGGEVVERVKIVGKEHAVKTLHPILKAVFLVALWSIIRDRKAGDDPDRTPEARLNEQDNSSQAEKAQKPFRIEALTPRSERDPSNNATLRHSLTNGNYVTNCLIDCSLEPATEFWALARTLAEELSSEKGIKLGRGLQGLMGYLPDGQLEKKRKTGHEHHDATPPDPRPTKWEAFFLDKAASDSPFLVGLQISNLGYVRSDLLPAGATSLAFGQGSAPFSSPVSFNVVGCESGIRWTTCFRDGSAVTKREVERMDKVAMEIFGKLGAGGGGASEKAGVSLASLVNRA